MRFGIFSVVDHCPNELPRTGGHHFHEYGGIPAPPIWLAAAAERTKRIRLGSAVVVLPFDNPLRAAEDYAMVDILSGGRLNLGTGSGYLKHEFEGFGIPIEEKRERFDEARTPRRSRWLRAPRAAEADLNAVFRLFPRLAAL